MAWLPEGGPPTPHHPSCGGDCGEGRGGEGMGGEGLREGVSLKTLDISPDTGRPPVALVPATSWTRHQPCCTRPPTPVSPHPCKTSLLASENQGKSPAGPGGVERNLFFSLAVTGK